MTDATTLDRQTRLDVEVAALGGADDDPSFTLIAIMSPTPIDARTQCRRVGTFASLTAALHGRVDDVLEQLAANDGWLVTAEHVIVGSGEGIRAEVYSYVTQVGSDPGGHRVPLPYDPKATRRWLLAAHQLSE
jgi:hypothetical protein